MSQSAAGQAEIGDNFAATQVPSSPPEQLAASGYQTHLYIGSFASLDVARVEQALLNDWGFTRAWLNADPVTQTFTLQWECPRKQEPSEKGPERPSGTLQLGFIRCTGAMQEVLRTASGGEGVLASDELWMDDSKDVDAMTADARAARSMLLLAIAQVLPEHQCAFLQAPGDPQWFEVRADSSASTKTTGENRLRLFIVMPESLDVTQLEQSLLASGILSAKLEIDPVTRTLTCAWQVSADYVEESGVPTENRPPLSGVLTIPFIRCPASVRAVLRREAKFTALSHSAELWMDDAEDIDALPDAELIVQSRLFLAILNLLPEQQRALIEVPVDPKFYEEQVQLQDMQHQLKQADEMSFGSALYKLLYWAALALVGFSVVQFVVSMF